MRAIQDFTCLDPHRDYCQHTHAVRRDHTRKILITRSEEPHPLPASDAYYMRVEMFTLLTNVCNVVNRF